MVSYKYKILKFVLFISAFIYCIYNKHQYGLSIGFEVLIYALGMSLVFYVFMTLFGIILNLTGNYLITIIISLFLFLYLAYRFDKSGFNSAIVDIICCIIGVCFLSYDIYQIIGGSSEAENIK